ncbi:MAG TPA: DUF2845 domain-containing protein [Rudaea sp.]
MTMFRCSIAFLLLTFAFCAPAHALRCGTRLISAGDLDVQVRDRCGDPYWIDERYDLLINGAHSAFETQREVQYTAWYYNFGSNRLLVRLLFRDGRFVREETLGRGVETLGDSCDTIKFDRGNTSGELVAYCGQPLSRRDVVDEQVRRYGYGSVRRSEVHREQWVYDLGGRFLYLLNLRNGYVESVETQAK